MRSEQNPLGIEVVQTILCVDGSPPGPPDPWVAALPEALGRPTFLRPPENAHVDMRRVYAALRRASGWAPWQSKIGECRIVDVIVRDETHAVLVEWDFDRLRMTGHGGSGEEWKTARGLVELTPEEANDLTRVWNGVMTAQIETAKTERTEQARVDAFHAALRKKGLDGTAIDRRRRDALRAVGLDDETVAAERRKEAAALADPPDAKTVDMIARRGY